MIIPRLQQSKILLLTQQFPVISLTGPRQSGKTTLAKLCYPKYAYLNLENPLILNEIKQNTLGVLKKYQQGIIIDEAQKYPDLFSYIQVLVDEQHDRGKIVLTGSENLTLSAKVSQSLAGRVVNFTLLPLSLKELSLAKFTVSNWQQSVINGFYPAKISENIKPNIFYTNYISNYIDRDVRQIKNLGNLTTFTKFLIMLAALMGQQLNFEAISNDLGIDRKTVISWLSILEASYIVFQLPPYYKNLGKRLTKRSKLYFYDTGLACHLLGLTSLKQIHNYPHQGAVFENLVMADLLKSKFNFYSPANFYYWRDSNKIEVDLLIDRGDTMEAIEIKTTNTIKPEFTKHLNLFTKYLDYPQVNPIVIYSGNTQVVANTQYYNWQEWLNSPTVL